MSNLPVFHSGRTESRVVAPDAARRRAKRARARAKVPTEPQRITDLSPNRYGRASLKNPTPFFHVSPWKPTKLVSKAPNPPQLVANLHEKERGAISVDVRRCRYNAFVEADAYDIPIFSQVDAPVPTVPGELGDLMWIDTGTLGPRQSP